MEDPWNRLDDLAAAVSDRNSSDLASFEDDFVAAPAAQNNVNTCSSNKSSSFQPLQDSASYLANLGIYYITKY